MSAASQMALMMQKMLKGEEEIKTQVDSKTKSKLKDV